MAEYLVANALISACSFGVVFDAYFRAFWAASYAGRAADVSMGRLMFGPSAYATPQ
ncbi:MAG: hypothetical protein K0S19_1993 [Geminicoccaceae bacterium]|nr:hypothetical protein [Geminicoccaceae bacterium]